MVISISYFKSINSIKLLSKLLKRSKEYPLCSINSFIIVNTGLIASLKICSVFSFSNGSGNKVLTLIVPVVLISKITFIFIISSI